MPASRKAVLSRRRKPLEGGVNHALHVGDGCERGTRNGTPAARPVRKATGLYETAGLPTYAIGIRGSSFFPERLVMKKFCTAALAILAIAACGREGAITEPMAPDPLPQATGVNALGIDPTSGATIETNKDDYIPGEVVHLVGKGWAPGETVNLSMVENPDTHDNVSVNVQADSAGGFSLHYYDVQPHDWGVTFTLTATGAMSGSVAVATFTDGIYQVALPTSPAGIAPSIGYILRNGCALNTGASSGSYTGTRVAVNAGKVLVFRIPAPSGYTFQSYTLSPGLTASAIAPDSLCITGGSPSGPDQNKDVTLTYTVSAIATSMTLADSPDSPTYFGTQVTVTASLTPNTATGTVNFYEFTGGQTCDAPGGATALASPSVSGGSAAYGPVSLSVGSHTITACYVPTGLFVKSQASVVHVVNKATTSLSVTSDNDPSEYGENVKLEATVTVTNGSANPDGGTVNFAIGGTCNTTTGLIAGGTALSVSSGVISGGKASVTVNDLAVGEHDIVACYGGNASIAGSTGTYDNQNVNPVTTTVVASIETVSPQYSDEVTLKATITPHIVLTSELTGVVRFYFNESVVSCPASDPGAVASVAASDNVTAADDGVAEADYQILSASGSYKITACFYSTHGNFSNGNDDVDITVETENASVATGTPYGNAFPVAGTTADFTLTFVVREKNAEPDANAGALPGDIDNAGLAVALNAVGNGANSEVGACSPSAPVAGSSYSHVKTFTCSFTTVAVDAYEVVASVNGGYYDGGFVDALTVYDPAAGFVTGGGKFIYPGSEDRISFGLVFNFTGKGKTVPRGNLVVIRHKTNGDVCRGKSNDIDAPAVVGNTASFSGKANYGCTRPDGTTYDGAGNQVVTGWVEDNGQGSNATAPDRFWVRLTAPNSLLLMPNAASTSAAELTGGNIQVPQPSRQ
jgi:hypothetical protein